MSNELKPISRRERILSGEKIDPMNREEYFLSLASEKSGGGGGGSNPGVVTVASSVITALRDAMRDVIQKTNGTKGNFGYGRLYTTDFVTGDDLDKMFDDMKNIYNTGSPLVLSMPSYSFDSPILNLTALEFGTHEDELNQSSSVSAGFMMFDSSMNGNYELYCYFTIIKHLSTSNYRIDVVTARAHCTYSAAD